MSTGIQQSGRQSLLPAPSGFFGLVVFSLLVLTQSTKLLVDADTYTHIATGKWMLAHNEVLRTDIYSHTAPGIPWVAHEWGAQVFMAWLYQTGGLPAIAIAFAALAALSLALLYRFLERRGTDPLLALGLMTITLLLVFPHIYARPHLFTWLGGILCFDLLHREERWRWLLPLLMIPWSNLHGGFVLGLALQGVFLLGRLLEGVPESGWRRALRERRQDLIILLASVVTSLCNPSGVDVILFFLTVSAPAVSRYNPEWMSPDLQRFWPFRVYLVVLLLMLFRARQRPGWTNLLLLTLLLDASLAHRRHISLAAMFLLPLWVELLPAKPIPASSKTAGEFSPSSWSGPLLLTVISVTLLIALAFLPAAPREALARHFPISQRFPHRAWDWIAEHPPHGRVFNEYSWGAFLIYRTEGAVPVFIDGFADKYGGQVYGDYYRIANLDGETDELLDRYRIDWVFFPTGNPLLRYLVASGRWVKAYSDDQASVLIRKDPVGR